MYEKVATSTTTATLPTTTTHKPLPKRPAPPSVSVQRIITTKLAALCVPATGGRVQYTGRLCGDGKQIEWVSAKALDVRAGVDAAQCTWDWLKHGARTLYAGSCGVGPTMAGGDSLPTTTAPTSLGDFVGCKKGGRWARPYGNVPLTAAGAEECLRKCFASGYEYAGMECPMSGSNQVHCQCSSDAVFTTETDTCARGADVVRGTHCNGAKKVGPYDTGGHGTGSVYQKPPTTTKPATTYAPPSRVADCPSGYTNMGITCHRVVSTYSAASSVASCPSGYTNTGATCHRVVSTYSAGSSVASCPSGYTNWGATCHKPVKCSGGLPWTWKCTGGGSVGMGSMTCPSNRFKKGARCYVRCKAGYTNNGETCGRAAHDLSMGSMTCPSNRFKTGARCYVRCKAGYTNNGETCGRAAHDLIYGCRSTEFSAGARCYTKCKPGYTFGLHLGYTGKENNLCVRTM